jgi:predicted permease
MAWKQLLRRGGGFAWMMVVMLALGIGATTAMFSVVNGVLLRPLALNHPGQLVLVGETFPHQASTGFHYFDTPSAFYAWRAHATDFSGFAAIQSNTFTLTGAGAPQLLHGAKVSASFFAVVGVHPALGRLLVPADTKNPARPIVLTDALWRSAFHADPAIVGRTIGTPRQSAVVVGVLPPSFRMAGRELGPMFDHQPVQYYSAIDLAANGDITSVFSNFNYTVLGRLRPGVTVPQALAQINGIQANLARSAHTKGLTLGGEIATVQDYTVAEARPELWLLLGGVGAVLLIVCVNLGGLWLTRLADRRRDWAIRAALGAAPGRLAREVLVEGVVLAVLGGGLGMACAGLSLKALLAAAPANLPRLNDVHLDWRVLGFGLALAIVCGLLTGLLPALRLSRSDPHASLKAGSGSATADRSSLRSRQALIALQAALATLLLAATGLLGLSFYRLIRQPSGFTAGHAVAADVILNAYSGKQRDAIARQLPAAIDAIPGVTAAGITSYLPLQGQTWVDSAGVPGKIYPAAQTPSVNVRFVGPGYFRAIGISLLAGRGIRESDRSVKAGVAVLTAAAAHLLWPGVPLRSLVGRRIVFNDHGNATQPVVGIAADARATLTKPAPALVYQAYWTYPPYHLYLVARSPLPEAALAAPLRQAIWKLASAAPIPQLRPLAALQTDAVAPQRYQLTLLLLFAGLALLLAALGVYALVAHSVARRAKELAIRVTLGAAAGSIRGMVLRQALAPVAAGVAAGLVLALAFGRLLASMLFQVAPASPPVLAAVGAAVLLAALAAGLIPARRATRADPLLALRAE